MGDDRHLVKDGTKWERGKTTHTFDAQALFTTIPGATAPAISPDVFADAVRKMRAWGQKPRIVTMDEVDDPPPLERLLAVDVRKAKPPCTCPSSLLHLNGCPRERGADRCQEDAK